MANTPVPVSGANAGIPQRGVYLTVDDIERLAKAYQTSIKSTQASSEAKAGSCGVIVCGNGAAI
jgi:hypothetical protein